MRHLIFRIFKQIKYDKRLLGLVFAAPLLLLTLSYFLMGSSSYVPKIGVALPDPFVRALEKQDVEISSIDISRVDELLKDRTIDAAVYMNNNKITMKFFENDTFRMGSVTKAVQNAMKLLNPSGDMEVLFIHGKSDASLFDNMGYIMLGIIAFFFVFILSGVSFIRERTNGTLERFILSPIKRWEIIGGYTIAYGIIAIIQSTIILLFAEFVLKMNIGSAMPLTILIMLMLSFTGVSVGILISVASNNEFQVVQFIPIIILPQVFFSGLIPVDTIPYHLGTLSYFMPVYYACDALKRVIVYRDGIGAIWTNLVVLAGILLVLSIINTRILKHFRKI